MIVLQISNLYIPDLLLQFTWDLGCDTKHVANYGLIRYGKVYGKVFYLTKRSILCRSDCVIVVYTKITQFMCARAFNNIFKNYMLSDYMIQT